MSTSLSIRQLPVNDRPREKLIGSGPRALSDVELIAVLFGTGGRGKSALQLSRELLARFGSLRGLLSAELEKCLEMPGVGLARYCLLQAVLELARRHYLQALSDRALMTAPAALRTFLVAQLRDRPYEAFCCLLLDTRHRLIAFEELFRGTIDGASVHPREVVRLAIARNAAAIVFAHNHP